MRQYNNRANGLSLNERINAKSYGGPMFEGFNEGSKEKRKDWIDVGLYPNDKELRSMTREEAEKWFGKNALSRPAERYFNRNWLDRISFTRKGERSEDIRLNKKKSPIVRR